MSRMLERIADWNRERRIEAIKAEWHRASAEGSKAECRALWESLRDEINSRSPAQVARMERKRGLTP